MKKVQIISICILIVTLVVMVVNRFIPLSDWIIRIDGIIILAALLVVSFSTVRCIREKS